MKIFVDEAGIFVIPKGKKWSISCVGALSIPDQLIEDIYTGFEEIKKSWGIKGEVKGRKLNEPKIADLIGFLSQFDIIFEVTALRAVAQTWLSPILRVRRLPISETHKFVQQGRNIPSSFCHRNFYS